MEIFLFKLINKYDNFDGNQTKVEFKFKIDSYNNDLLFIRNTQEISQRIKQLENCHSNGEILICEISKDNLDIIAVENNKFEVFVLNDLVGHDPFMYIDLITVNYIIPNKEDIYLKLENSMLSKVDLESYIAFSTNITNINKLQTAKFKLTTESGSPTSYFIKHEDNSPLYLICYVSKKENFVLGNIAKLELKDIHYKYNFIITQEKNDDIVSVIEPDKPYTYKIYPEVLDFSNQDNLYIYFGNLDSNFKIKLNPDGDDLNCINIEYSQKCTVPKSHFAGKSNGYYYIHHKNNANEYTVDYDTFGFKVILTSGGGGGDGDGGSNSSIIINKHSLLLIALSGLLLLLL